MVIRESVTSLEEIVLGSSCTPKPWYSRCTAFAPWSLVNGITNTGTPAENASCDRHEGMESVIRFMMLVTPYTLINPMMGGRKRSCAQCKVVLLLFSMGEGCIVLSKHPEEYLPCKD